MTSFPPRGLLVCVPLALCLLLPGVSQAARQPPPDSSPPPAQPATVPSAETAPPAPRASTPEPRAVPGTQQDAPRRLVTEGEEPWQTPAHTPPPRGLRILAEAGAGLGGMVVLGLGGGLAGIGICALGQVSRPSTGGLDDLWCFIPIGLGVAVGTLVGFPLGVWMAGEGLEGNGSFLAALGFGTLGVLVGGLLINTVPVAPLLLLGAGSLLGYELFQSAPLPRGLGAHVRLQPVVSFSGFGGHAGPVLGLSGRF